ncbi:hypothetical protein [Janthinobacterium sp. HLX7-2]|uniref:hypothetical protein n=1 Tax=Janthinobacterium sp. HLX7-2 TaxID=1259331 RepID=UPI003F1F2CBD
MIVTDSIGDCNTLSLPRSDKPVLQRFLQERHGMFIDIGLLAFDCRLHHWPHLPAYSLQSQSAFAGEIIKVGEALAQESLSIMTRQRLSIVKRLIYGELDAARVL